MVSAQSIPLIIMASLTFYVGAYNVLLFIKQPRRWSHATFAASCICMAMYDVFCAGLYGVASPAAGAAWQRLQFAALALVGIACSWFVVQFLSAGPLITRQTRIVVGGFSLRLLLTAIVGMVFPNGAYVLPDT